MADQNYIHAKDAYNTLCTALDNIGWKYKRMDDELKIMFGVNGDDLAMNFLIIVDADRQLVRLLSLLPFKMDENKRVEGAIATCVVNYLLADGSFDYDLEEGNILFRLTSSFRESLLSQELFHYMVSVSCHTIDKYNDQFLALNNGDITITEFIEKNS